MNISVFGNGKLGSPMAALFAHAGHSVFCIDRSPAVLDAIRARKAPVEEPGLQDLFDLAGDRLTAVPFERAAEAVASSQFVFVIVPTPSRPDGSFSNDYILEALQPIGQAIKDEARPHVVITCTVSPGACEKVLIPELDRLTGRCAGLDYQFSYNPEFIALGSVIRNMRHPDFILIGSKVPAGADELEQFYADLHRRLNDPVPPIAKLNLVNAEIAKLAVNCFCTMKISYANQLGWLCDALTGGDAQAVCRAIGLDSRIGSKYLRPAGPFGGPCFPRDCRAMIEAADRAGTSVDLWHATNEINDESVRDFRDIIVERSPRCVAVLGLTYKPDTGVTEESLSARLIPDLQIRAVGPKLAIQTHDPLAPASDRWPCRTETPREAILDADVVVLATDHAQYHELKAEWFKTNATILDVWNVLDGRDEFRHFRRWVPGRGYK